MHSTRAAAFRVLALAEIIIGVACILGVLGGNAHFVQRSVASGEFGEAESKSVIIATLVALTTGVTLLFDGRRRLRASNPSPRSASIVILALAGILILNIGAPIERIAKADDMVLSARQQNLAGSDAHSSNSYSERAEGATEKNFFGSDASFEVTLFGSAVHCSTRIQMYSRRFVHVGGMTFRLR
jgi:hypothetical protein